MGKDDKDSNETNDDYITRLITDPNRIKTMKAKRGDLMVNRLRTEYDELKVLIFRNLCFPVFI